MNDDAGRLLSRTSWAYQTGKVGIYGNNLGSGNQVPIASIMASVAFMNPDGRDEKIGLFNTTRKGLTMVFVTATTVTERVKAWTIWSSPIKIFFFSRNVVSFFGLVISR